MIQVVDRIIEIEKSNHLYELIDDKGIPVWDVLRYDVIKAIEYKYNPNKEMLSKSSLVHRLRILAKAVLSMLPLLLLSKRRYFFYAHSRNKNREGQLFDRIAFDLISRTKKPDRIVFDASPDKVKLYRTEQLPIGFFYAVCRHFQLDLKTGQSIVRAVNTGFEEEVISFHQLQNIYKQFTAQVRMFDWLLKKLKPEKIIISYGRFKPLCFAARKASIPTWLMQHSLIEKDDATISGTCPDKQFGINADVLLTFGEYWGHYLRHLMDVQVIGNRFMCKERLLPQYDGSIVVTSSLYQGPCISTFFKSFIEKHPKYRFIYKLHPGEKANIAHYKELFSGLTNVQVILDEYTMDELLEKCSLVVMVSSTTFYEALNLKKCVAVYNIEQFKSITRFLLKVPNSYSFTTEEELEYIIENAKFDDSTAITFFEPFKEDVASKILS